MEFTNSRIRNKRKSPKTNIKKFTYFEQYYYSFLVSRDISDKLLRSIIAEVSLLPKDIVNGRKKSRK